MGNLNGVGVVGAYRSGRLGAGGAGAVGPVMRDLGGLPQGVQGSPP